MKRLVGITALAIGAMLVLNGPAWSDDKSKGKMGSVLDLALRGCQRLAEKCEVKN